MHLRVQRHVVAVVAEQGELHAVDPGARQPFHVVVPGIRRDRGRVRRAGYVLPTYVLERERAADRSFGLWARVGPVSHGAPRPEAVEEAGLVGVAVLRDDRLDGVWCT